MRRVRHFLSAALACAGSCSAQTLVLDTFNAGAATGAVRTDTSWLGNVTQNAATITIGGSALNDNGWGASSLSLNATGTTFLTITGQRDAGHTASVFAIQFEDASLNTHVLYVSASAFAVGTLTQVQIPLPAWASGFSAAQISSWSIGGGNVTGATFHMTLDHLAFTSAATSGATLAPMGTSTLGTALTGSGGLTLNGAGTLVLGVTNTFSGPVTLDQGTLRLGAAGALPASLATSIGAGTTLDLNGFAATVGPLTGSGAITLGAANLTIAQATASTFSGPISGAGGLVKTGTGTLTLSGTSTYSGATTISGGTLHLTGSAASSAFTLNSGGTLSGTGTLGALTINSGGTLSPGASPGTLAAGATTFAGGGAMTWEINNATGVSGTNYDLLSISGGLTISATSGSPFTINLTSLTLGNVAGLAANFNAASNYTFTFVTTTTGITGFSADKFALNTSGFTNPFTASGWSIAQSGNALTLSYAGASAIPEPSTYAALAGAAMLGCALYRRSRRNR